MQRKFRLNSGFGWAGLYLLEFDWFVKSGLNKTNLDSDLFL